MKKGKSMLAVIITVVIMLVLFAGFIFAGIKLGVLKFDMGALGFGKGNQEKKQEENVDIYSKEYNVDDYISVSKDEESGLKLISIKKLNTDALEKFKNSQEKFKELEVKSGNRKTNIVRTNTNKAILSVYTKETVKNVEGIVSESSYAVNINIENNVEVKNIELIELYNINIDSISKAIINKFVEVSNDIKFTDISGNQINASDIKSNSNVYIKIINDNIEKLVVYTRKDKLYVDVNPSQLMQLFSLNSTDSNKLIEITSITI